ncbi:MAG: hypothetical protein NUV59_03455 [Patescibacteria group bacterium]|nr:hypothetical protein [Patescibacteria group bacterium]
MKYWDRREKQDCEMPMMNLSKRFVSLFSHGRIKIGTMEYRVAVAVALLPSAIHDTSTSQYFIFFLSIGMVSAAVVTSQSASGVV